MNKGLIRMRWRASVLSRLVVLSRILVGAGALDDGRELGRHARVMDRGPRVRLRSARHERLNGMGLYQLEPKCSQERLTVALAYWRNALWRRGAASPQSSSSSGCSFLLGDEARSAHQPSTRGTLDGRARPSRVLRPRPPARRPQGRGAGTTHALSARGPRCDFRFRAKPNPGATSSMNLAKERS